MTVYPRIMLYKTDGGHYDWYTVAEDCVLGPLLISEGFITDFASVPQLIWWLIPPHGLAAMPSLVHDYLYQTPDAHNLTRKQVDRSWLELMRKSGVPFWQRGLMYVFVRMLGGRVWEKYRK
mgnify:CR=1 FL=1